MCKFRDNYGIIIVKLGTNILSMSSNFWQLIVNLGTLNI